VPFSQIAHQLLTVPDFGAGSTSTAHPIPLPRLFSCFILSAEKFSLLVERFFIVRDAEPHLGLQDFAGNARRLFASTGERKAQYVYNLYHY